MAPLLGRFLTLQVVWGGMTKGRPTVSAHILRRRQGSANLSSVILVEEVNLEEVPRYETIASTNQGL